MFYFSQQEVATETPLAYSGIVPYEAKEDKMESPEKEEKISKSRERKSSRRDSHRSRSRSKVSILDRTFSE